MTADTLRNEVLCEIEPAFKHLANLQVEPRKTNLTIARPETWDDRNVKSQFAYFEPQRNHAVVREDSPYRTIDVFHEFLGHGSHLEHTRGRTNRLSHGTEHARLEAEIAASGVEYYYAVQQGRLETYKHKKKSLNENREQLRDHVETKLDTRGFKPFLWDQGYPKHYSTDNLYDTIKPFLKEEPSLALHYGSGKPRSDVDLFLVGQTPYYERDWLDIYQVPQRKVTDLIDNLDISVLDPLFTGTLLHGDKRELERLKNRAKNKSIQPAAVHHNERRAHQQSIHDHPTAESYTKTYAKHAAHLRRGKKHLTKTSLIDEAA